MVIGTIDKKSAKSIVVFFSAETFSKNELTFSIFTIFFEKYFIRTNVNRDLCFWCCVQPPTAWSLAKKRWVWAKYFIFRCCLAFFRIRYWNVLTSYWNFGNCADTKYCRMLFFSNLFCLPIIVLHFVVPDVNVNWGDTPVHCQYHRIWAELGTCSNSPDWIVYRHASDGHKVHVHNLHFVSPLSPILQESKNISFLHL